ncbi:diphthine--ammonia ligase [Desmophyllum pertusum]|uniref:Diphthine--ammonia ligase n=1 Tax=Desmophyllum pertusum TaxID=174260 RepID=A0A9X0CT30_9CNID|nr:diphthine--ammonia ligase [Desmophyllum pertusum]
MLSPAGKSYFKHQYDSHLCPGRDSVLVYKVLLSKEQATTALLLTLQLSVHLPSCNLDEVMETFVSELQCCTSRHNISFTDLMYMRIFYVKDIMDHWHAQDFIHRSLERTIVPAPPFSLIPVDALEKESTVMLFCCFLQKPGDSTLEY